MIYTAQEFYDMVTKHKDRSLGAWTDRAEMKAQVEYILSSVADVKLSPDKIDAIMDQMETTFNEHNGVEGHRGMNVDIHFIIQKESMQQYISPMTEEYKVGKSHRGTFENILWSLYPEEIKAGYCMEITRPEGPNKSIKFHNEHKYGEATDHFNIVLLHTFSFDYTEKRDSVSDIHMVVLIPAGDLIYEISQIHIANIDAQKAAKKNVPSYVRKALEAKMRRDKKKSRKRK